MRYQMTKCKKLSNTYHQNYTLILKNMQELCLFCEDILFLRWVKHKNMHNFFLFVSICNNFLDWSKKFWLVNQSKSLNGHWLVIEWKSPRPKGDPSGQLQPPIDLDLGCFAILPGAVGSYSSSPPAAGTARTKSTKGFYHGEWSPCTYIPLARGTLEI